MGRLFMDTLVAPVACMRGSEPSGIRGLSMLQSDIRIAIRVIFRLTRSLPGLLTAMKTTYVQAGRSDRSSLPGTSFTGERRSDLVLHKGDKGVIR